MKSSLLLKFYLFNDSAEHTVGALMEEYGNYASMHTYPEEILEGYTIQQHLSAVFLNHPAFLKSEQLLPCTLRKYSSKILPIFYDHFLRANWEETTGTSFEAFYGKFKMEVLENQPCIPFKYARLLKYMNRQNWMNAFKTVGGTHQILLQQVKKFHFNVNLECSIDSLIEHYSAHKQHFFELLPDLEQACKEYHNSMVFKERLNYAS